MVQSFPRGLSITAIGARDLAKRKIFGAQDPYLAFFFQGRRKFTNVAVKGGVKPEWNQVIKYNKIEDPSGDATLKVTCTHEQTGVKVGSGDGLIGSCEIDLKRVLFSKESGEHEGWFQLMYDGRESGEVRLRLSLCDPSEEEDETEDAPVRIANPKNRLIRTKDKASDKTAQSSTPPPSTSVNSGARPSTALGLRKDDKAEVPGESYGVQRTPSNPLGRRRSFADLQQQKQRPLASLQEPTQHRLGSKSFEEVREGTNVGSPKPTFTSQDSNGNINQLNVLIAPFDPNWLEPTPKLLKRALSKQMYYEDLKIQQTTTQDLFPRTLPQQPSYNNYQSFTGYPQGPEATQFPQPYPQQRPPGMPMGMPQPPPRMTRDQSYPPLSPSAQNYPPLSPSAPNWSSPPSKGEIPFQPHSMYPSQTPRSRMDAEGNSKYNSLPSRTHISPQVMQQLRNIDDGSGQFNSGMMPNPQEFSQSGGGRGGAPSTFTPQMSSLGPATGCMPETYSQEHQRVLVNQFAPPAPFMAQSHGGGGGSSNGPGSSNGSNMGSGPLMMPGSPHDVMERPGTSNAFYPQSPTTAQPMGPLSPTPNYGQQRTTPPGQHSMYGSSMTPQNQQQQYGSRQQHPPPMSPQNWSSSSFPGSTNTREIVSAPISLHSTKSEGPTKVKDAIFSQYTPRPGSCEGNDIQDSVFDQSMGRRILGRYALGLTREKYVREGFYSKDKSPFLADNMTQQYQQRPPNARQLQRQFTMDMEGNDRVILKYLKLRRDWEIDCVMMRYLTCQHPEEKLGSQYLDYPQPQQLSQHMNPFVVGLYETFMHPQGSDADGCRYLNVLQWFPETLQGYISDSIASGEGLEVTLPIVRSLIECVEWIHRRKICHLNIKPSNFVRDPYMSSSIHHHSGIGWKLVDFEAARVADEEVVGRCTFSYAAPELLVGNSTNVGVLAKTSLDIWSLGLVIYELLTDQPLFRTDDDARDVLLQGNNNNGNGNLRGGFKPIRYYDSKNVSPEYIPLLDAMLAQDPEKRLTAAQLLQMDIFTKPISAMTVPQHQLIRNNNILSLGDLPAARLCHLKSHGGGSGDQGGGGGGSNEAMLLEGVGRILDSPFDHIPRLFMILPPTQQDLQRDSTQFIPTNLLQNSSLRLVLLCEGLSGYGEDAHVTDHRGYILQEPAAFVQDVGKLLLHLVATASATVNNSNNINGHGQRQNQSWTLTGTSLDNCKQWYPSLGTYYEALQGAIQQQVGPGPSLNELRTLRGPTLKALEQWLVRLVRKECLMLAESNLRREPSTVSYRGGRGGGGGYDDLSDQLGNTALQDPDLPEVTGPGGGEGYGGLYKMPVGTYGDRWICRGCVSKQMANRSAAQGSSSSAV